MYLRIPGGPVTFLWCNAADGVRVASLCVLLALAPPPSAFEETQILRPQFKKRATFAQVIPGALFCCFFSLLTCTRSTTRAQACACVLWHLHLMQSRVTGMFEHLQTRATSLFRMLLSYSVISTMVGIVIVAVFRCAHGTVLTASPVNVGTGVCECGCAEVLVRLVCGQRGGGGCVDWDGVSRYFCVHVRVHVRVHALATHGISPDFHSPRPVGPPLPACFSCALFSFGGSPRTSRR